MTNEKAVLNIHFKIMSGIMRIVSNFRNIRQEIISSGIKKGSHVLDYGCGPGFVTIPAAKIVGDQGAVYALDIHPLSIQIIKRKIKKYNLKNVKTILTNKSTGLPDESIDIVLLFNVIFMIKDKEVLIKELHRVLKKGGIISIANSGLGSKLKKNQIIENSLTELICKEHNFILSEKIRSNFNFTKLQ